MFLSAVELRLIVLPLVFHDGRDDVMRDRVLLVIEYFIGRLPVVPVLRVVDVLVLVDLEVLFDLVRIIVLDLVLNVVLTFYLDHVHANNLSDCFLALALTVVRLAFIILLIRESLFVLELAGLSVPRLNHGRASSSILNYSGSSFLIYWHSLHLALSMHTRSQTASTRSRVVR